MAEPATLFGIECASKEILRAELSFAIEPAHGQVLVRVHLREAVPFPYSPLPARPTDALTFEKALRSAERELGVVAVHVDSISENDTWWLFGTRQIGGYGAVVRKIDGKAAGLGSGSGSFEAALWAFDRGLLDPVDAITVTRVHDLATSVRAFAQYLRRPESEVAALLEIPGARIPLDFINVDSLWRAREAFDFEPC